MIPYANGVALNSANYSGMQKTPAVFDFSSTSDQNLVNDDFSQETHLNWIFSQTPLEKGSLQAHIVSATKSKKVPEERSISNIIKRKIKKKQRRSSKTRNCILKKFKSNRKKIRRNRNRMQRKYVIPFILGFLTAKSLLIPVAFKILAFISTKGLMMGFFSTALASLLSLKGLFEHSRGYKERKDDTKTQVEIIQIPSKNEDHIYYDEHYTKRDYVPIVY